MSAHLLLTTAHQSPITVHPMLIFDQHHIYYI